jgi:prepilin-type processing-associated H-X9-DG protein
MGGTTKPVDENRTVSPNGVPLYLTNYLGIFSGYRDGDQAWGEYPSMAVNQPDHVNHIAVFGPGRGASITEIRDGASNTLALAEYLTGTPADMRGYSFTHAAGCQFLYVANTPNSTVPDAWMGYVGWCQPPTGSDPASNLPCTPCDYPDMSACSRSRHPGGVNAVLCDGSVQFFTDTIDLNLWRSLAWIDDGRPMGSF